MNKFDLTKPIWRKSDFEIEFPNAEKRVITIIHNAPEFGKKNTIEAAFQLWLQETFDHSARAFVKYIRSKGVYWAFTTNQVTILQERHAKKKAHEK